MRPVSSTAEYLGCLRQNRLFTAIPQALTGEICARIPLVSAEPGEVIFYDGEAGDCFYLLCSGGIRVSKQGRGGLQEALGYIQPGDFFGEMAMIDVEPRSAQATAMEESVLGRIDQPTFEHIFLIAPGQLHSNLLRCVTARLREVSEHFIEEVVRTERLSLVGSMANSIIHDLKNPISVIRTCSELLRMKFQDPAATRFTSMVNRAVNNMLEMIQELLEFSKGQSSFHPQLHPVSSVFADLLPRLEPLLPEKIRLRTKNGCEGWILADLSRFSRMLLNLAKNSIEAMEHGGELVLRTDPGTDRVVFTIADTGCGIPPEIRARLFEPFVTAGKHGGTGLGMAIVKSVVDAHHGVITVESEPGRGTSMHISIPLQPPPPVPPQPPESHTH